jgi:hypothetical protein
MYITMKSYLGHLEALERSRPPVSRRAVPTIGELADELGIHRVTLSNIINGNIRQLDLKTGGRIITAMRKRGFEMDVTDLIAYRPPEERQP